MLAPWKKSSDKPRQHIKKQRHHFADKGPSSQSYSFSSSHVWMWELDRKEGYMQVKTQQLELDMEQQTGSKLGKEYDKAVYCHPAV